MSERIEERLRRAAQTYRKLGNHTAEVMFLEAADTLTELRGALQVASVDYRHLSEENAKLRELCRRFAEYVSQDKCEGCVCKRRCNNGEIDECWQRTEIREAAHEFGIEVDE